ncbi:hypothetical protein [Xenorhabdus griffiniae]|uniref:Secreted protein n=1 Tax=Xenorhabdus griffiniae TaxID=351672 RepID=A0ABY9XJ69_9GAMM|nr:hypothetical protein [Xenorhabdus griffiniae]MBD1226796.1 hypothetical protein [Xenorhabdus griffiniae]MBE8586801.1 hypothetical protein [Xenorhabdus griffiniae]WMV72946.1 hypothetical protein QL128_02490 [Xenorhabdus griffiniae]WNH02625.1 hypothetical protein QL112_002495 [Xenorhabdus griffiniae]
MRLLSQILFFSFISLASLPSLAKFSTPAEIMKQVQERGINSVVAEINAEYKQDKIIQNIATGDKQWLQVAFKLYPNIHPEFSRQIINALSVALIENPEEVLSLIKTHRTLSFIDICNMPSTIKGRSQQKLFIKRIINSLRAAEQSNKGKDQYNIEACIWEFERALSYM